VGGPFLLQWMEVDEPEPNGPTHKWDAVDGGTTASVIVVKHGAWVVLAAVGDSSIVLTADGAGGAEGAVVAELMIDEHSPTNAEEYRRLRSFEEHCGVPPDCGLRFVYDCPDFEQFDIFLPAGAPDGMPRKDRDAEKLADKHECSVKNSRGDLFTVVNVPEMHLRLTLGTDGTSLAADESAGVETLVDEQAITMTRSLGDFYAHHHGVSCEPQLRTLDLAELRSRGLCAPRLVLASDGLWDLWTFEEVAHNLMAAKQRAQPACGAEAGPSGGDCPLRPVVTELCEVTRARGADYFGEGADNLTGIVVDLSFYATGPA